MFTVKQTQAYEWLKNELTKYDDPPIISLFKEMREDFALNLEDALIVLENTSYPTPKRLLEELRETC